LLAVRYENFSLQIVPGRTSRYVVYAESPQGEGKGPFRPPLTWRREGPLGVRLPGDCRPSRDLRSRPEPVAESFGAYGEQLFEALFPPEVRRLYESSVAQVAAGPEVGLRIKLVLDPNDPDLAGLLDLPWETLRRPGAPEFLALTRGFSIVRYLLVPRPVRAASRPPKLRILTLAANPRSLSCLDLKRELKNLVEAVRPVTGVEILQAPAPTLACLRQALREQECHVLHFLGHGGFNAELHRGALYFETADGSADLVQGEDLANLLAGFPMLRLVVLNACQSARVSGGPNTEMDPPRRFGGVATSLVMGGLPAVIAMQSAISDAAAIAFSRVFYRQLAAGEPVDAAVVEGRHEIYSESKERTEWATPVLFMRAKTGELFPAADLPPESPVRPRETAGWLLAALLLILLATGAWLASLEVLLHEGSLALEEGQAEAAREKFLQALSLAPYSAEAHNNLALAEEALGNPDAAQSHFRAAVRLRPHNPRYLYNLGNYLNAQGDHREAFQLLKEAIYRDPRYVAAYNELARAALGQGLPEQARAALQVALKIDPDAAPLYNQLGQADLLQKNIPAAIQHLHQALARYPLGDSGRVEALGLLVIAYDRQDDPKNVCRYVSRFRSVDVAGLTPQAPDVNRIAARRHCEPASLRKEE
jgi:Tfp pilus assembly protein PilF